MKFAKNVQILFNNEYILQNTFNYDMKTQTIVKYY